MAEEEARSSRGPTCLTVPVTDSICPDALRVVRAGFAAVKGTRHLAYDAVSLDADGAVGDRAYCLVDAEARRVLKTVQNPTLVAVTARVEGRLLEVVLPDGRSARAEPVPTGETLTCDYWGRSVPLALLDGPHATLFSDHLGRGVRLAAAPRGGVVFGDPVAVIATASLRDLAEHADQAGHTRGARLDSARFRATLLVETDEPYAEERWLGQDAEVGGVRLRFGLPIPRCAVIDLDPSTGVRDGRLLKTLASYRPLNGAGEPAFGVYARVLGPGTVSPS